MSAPLRRARKAYRAGDTRACRAHLDRGLAEAPPDSSEEAQLRAVEARLLLWERPALTEARAALSLARRSGAPTWEAELAVGTALALEGRSSAIGQLDQALASAATRAERAETHLLKGVALHDLARLTAARHEFAAAARVSKRADIRALARFGEAHAALLQADYDFAIPALESARDGPLGMLADDARAILAIALADRGDDERATAFLNERAGVPTAWSRASLLAARAEVEWSARRLERCIAVAEECAGIAMPLVYETALLTRGWARLELGLDPDLPEIWQTNVPLTASYEDERQGLRALADGRHADARRALLRAARKLRTRSIRGELRAQLGAAYACEALGETAAARRQRRAIEHRARALGMASIWRRLEATLEPSSRAELSPRRRQVVELIATGLSSGEIADRLDISRATVESHVRALLTQTGARTRVAAAAQLLPPTRGSALQPEDQRIVDLLATGTTVTEAALLLHVSRRTLTRRIAGIRERVGADSNASLVARRTVSD